MSRRQWDGSCTDAPGQPRRRGRGRGGRDTMTNTIAAGIAVVVAGLVAADLAFGWGGTLFVARRFVILLENLAIWR